MPVMRVTLLPHTRLLGFRAAWLWRSFDGEPTRRNVMSHIRQAQFDLGVAIMRGDTRGVDGCNGRIKSLCVILRRLDTVALRA